MPKTPPQNPPEQRMTPIYDDGSVAGDQNKLNPLNQHENIKKPPARATAVAITYDENGQDLPRIAAAGRGKLAEQILQIAFEKGIKVREDAALADMLAKVELDSPIPSEAFLAVAEILSYIYRANGEPNPFHAILDNLNALDETQNQPNPLHASPPEQE